MKTCIPINAHGIIRGIDAKAALQMPGVLAVYTGADLKDYGPLKCIVALNNRDGSPLKKPRRERNLEPGRLDVGL